MKKLVYSLVAVFGLLCLTSCGSSEDESVNNALLTYENGIQATEKDKLGSVGSGNNGGGGDEDEGDGPTGW